MSLIKKISQIQSNMKAHKGQYNSFGKYAYRSCEDILQAIKPYLLEHELVLSLSDSIELIGDRFYVKATATLTDDLGQSHTVTAYAREALSKKGMDESQITGATSSYARKYALNGLLCIDDTRDADATNQHGKDAAPAQQSRPKLTPENKMHWSRAVEVYKESRSFDRILAKMDLSEEHKKQLAAEADNA